MNSILEKISNEIFNIIKGHGRSLMLYGQNGNVVYDPADAVRMFITPDRMMLSIMIDDDNDIEIKLYVGKRTEIKNIEVIINTIRSLCSRFNAVFNIRRFGKEITPKDFAYQVKTNESIIEAYYGSLKTSYENIGNCKIIIKHTENVDEQKRGSRSRNIKNLYVENASKEKILLPTNNLKAARALARHISNGGTLYDTVGDYVVEASKEYDILKNVVKQIRKKNSEKISSVPVTSDIDKINSEKSITPDPIVVGIKENIFKRIDEITKTFGVISGSRNYNRYKDFISSKNIFETTREGEIGTDKLNKFCEDFDIDMDNLQIIANVMAVKQTTLPTLTASEDDTLSVISVYKRRYKYGIDYTVDNCDITFYNPDCFSEFLSYFDTRSIPYEFGSETVNKVVDEITIRSDNIQDIIDILRNELGYDYDSFSNIGDTITIKKCDILAELEPLLNISNIKFESLSKLNETDKETKMPETNNKVLDFATKWIASNTDSSVSVGADDTVHDRRDISEKPAMLADALLRFMKGHDVPNIKPEPKRNFSSKVAETGYKVSIVADSVQNDVLSNFLSVVAEKVRDGKSLEVPEKQVAQKATQIYDASQEQAAVPAPSNDDAIEQPAMAAESAKPRKFKELRDLEEWFKKIDVNNITEDDDTLLGAMTSDANSDAPEDTSSDSQNDDCTVSIKLVNDDATLATLNKISELTGKSTDELTSSKSAEFSGTKDQCQGFIDQVTAEMNQNGDLGSVDISGPSTPAETNATNAVSSMVGEDTEEDNNEDDKDIEEIDESYIVELNGCLEEMNSSDDITFRVIEHQGTWAVVNEQTGVIVNQYTDHSVANKICENYNENKITARDHLKTIIEMALSEAEMNASKKSKEAAKKIMDEKKIREAVAYVSENVDVMDFVNECMNYMKGRNAIRSIDKFTMVSKIAEGIFSKVSNMAEFDNIGLTEEHFMNISDNFYQKAVVPMLENKGLYETVVSMYESAEEDDKIDFSKPVSITDADSEDQLKKINKEFKSYETKADKLKADAVDFDIVNYKDKWHVIEKNFPAVCMAAFGDESKARQKAADFISDPEYGIEVLGKKIRSIIEDTDVDKDDKKEKIEEGLHNDVDSDENLHAIYHGLSKKFSPYLGTPEAVENFIAYISNHNPDTFVEADDSLRNDMVKEFVTNAVNSAEGIDKVSPEHKVELEEELTGMACDYAKTAVAAYEHFLASETSLDEDRSFNEIINSAADSVDVGDMLANGDFGEPGRVDPHLENVFCARIAEKMYKNVISSGEDVGTVTPNNFMGPASFLMAKNMDKFRSAGFVFDNNSAYNESEEETIPTNDQATFKDEVSSDIVNNPEQDDMDRLRQLAGLKK